MFHGPAKSIVVLALPTRRTYNDTKQIEEGHREICCIAGEGIVDGEGLRFKISVRVGYMSESDPQGRYYCIFNFRMLFTQQCAELFLQRDTSPDSPLPHVDCSEGQKQVHKLKNDGVLQGFIQAGFRIIKRQQELGLPPSLAQAVVTEEFPDNSASLLVAKHHKLHAASSEKKPVGQSEEENYAYLRQLIPGMCNCMCP